MKNFYVVVLNCVFKKLYMIILTFFHGLKTCKNMLSRGYVIFQRGRPPVYRPRVTIPALPILPAATDDGRLPRPICRFAGNTRGMSVGGGFPAAPSAECVSQPWSWSTARDGQPRGPARLRPLRSLALQVNHTTLRRTRQPGSPESPDFWPPPAKQPALGPARLCRAQTPSSFGRGRSVRSLAAGHGRVLCLPKPEASRGGHC